MSWKTLNRILGLAAVDQDFWQALQQDPLAAVRAHGFELTPQEQQILCAMITNDLAELSRRLLEQLPSDR